MKGMLKVILVFVIMIMSMLTACSKGVDVIEGNIEENIEGKKDNSITIYCTENTKSYLNTASNILKLKISDAEVNIETFKNTKDMEMRLNTELIAGEGPDVIFFTPYTFESVYKLMEADILHNLNTLIEEDLEFDMDKYNKIIMDSGVINNKRYFIPLDYYVNAFITTEELMEKNNIEIDVKTWTLKQFKEKMKYYNDESGNEDKFFFSSPINFSTYIFSSGIKLIDYDNKKTYFNTDEFIDILQSYKEVFSKISASYDMAANYGYHYWEMMKDNTSMASSDSMMYNPKNLWMTNSIINEYINQHARAFSIPLYNDGGYKAQPFQMTAINSASKNKQLSYEFIKAMLSKQYQMQRDIVFAPVNKEAYSEIKEKYTGEEGLNQRIPGKVPVNNTIPISEELINDLDNIESNINECIIPDKTVMKFIDEAANNYVQNKCTIKQSVQELENKIMIYLNE